MTASRLIQALIVVLLVRKNVEDPFKIESTRVVTTFLPLLDYEDFSKRSRAGNSKVSGWTLHNFKPIGCIIGPLVSCKNEEDSIKNVGARVVTTLFMGFSDAQGQLTPKSVLPKRMKKIHQK